MKDPRDKIFSIMIGKTKMLFSNVLDHAGELHYDYLVDKKKIQIKRFETASTNDKFLGVNLSQTHGDRSAEVNFYKKTDFDDFLTLPKLKFGQFSLYN